MIRRRIGKAVLVTFVALFASVSMAWISSYAQNFDVEANWVWFGVTDHVTLGTEPGLLTVQLRHELLTAAQPRFRWNVYDADEEHVSPSDWAYHSRDTVWGVQFHDFRYYLMIPNYGGPAVSVRVISAPTWFLALMTGIPALLLYWNWPKQKVADSDHETADD